jgi:hypothetical protein
MAFTGNFMCTSFKQELLEGVHNFQTGGNSFKMALYDNSATLTAGTTAYTTSGELAATGNYTTTGNALTNVNPTATGTTAYCDFDDEVWGTATFTAYGALIYNDTAAGDPSVIVLDFGGAKTATAGDFTVQFPAADATNAIIRIGTP